MQLLVLLTIYQFQSSFSCQGWGRGKPARTTTSASTTTRAKRRSTTTGLGPLFGTGKRDHNLFRGDHWTLESKKIRSQWTEWYKQWVYKQKKLKECDEQAIAEGMTDCDPSRPMQWTRETL